VIRYGYNQQVSPPAPFVHVTVACPRTNKDWPDLPAQLDTACDRTVVPLRVLQALGIQPDGDLPVMVAGGAVFQMSIFLVQIAIRNCAPLTIEVFGHAEEPVVLLGRDVLNHHRIVLDGPNLSIEII
jgi:hypothetical protein